MVRPASNENSMTLQIVQSCRIVWARVCLIEIDYRTCFVMTVKFYGNKIWRIYNNMMKFNTSIIFSWWIKIIWIMK